MSDATAQPPDPMPVDLRPGPRRNRHRPRWGRRLAWVAGALLLAGVISAFSLRLWMEQYLKSDAFTAQLNATAGRVLVADCQLEEVRWQGATGYAGTFQAHGQEAAVFRSMNLAEVRAELDTGAIWDRVWRVPKVSIAQLTADFSAGGRAEAGRPYISTEAIAAPSASGGWLQSWLPNRTEIGPVQVERFDFVRKASPDAPGLDGSGFSLVIRPNIRSATMEVDARTGTVRMAGEKRTLQVDRLRATLRRDAAALDQLTGSLEDAAVTAEGTIGFLTPGDLRLKVGLAGASLEKWLPADWLRRCQGEASAKATLRGDWRHLPSVQVEGEFNISNATLQALPLLDIIAKKTQNASFLRMQVKVAKGRFERRRADQWELRQLYADAPGLLRLKGGVDITETDKLRGSLLLGVVPGTLRYLAGAEQTVFLTADKFTAAAGNTGVLSAEDAALLWTRFQLGGTFDSPTEDLSERLASAWFNATVDEVAALSMEAAATVTRTAAGAAGTVLQAAPPILEKAPDLLNQGVQGGLKIIDGLLPR